LTDANRETSELSDEALAGRTAAGDRAAFETLVVRYQARMYRLACRLVGEDDGADVVQDTFLSAFRRIDTFRSESKLSTWLYRIAMNAALMHRRSRTRQRTESIDAFMPQFESDGSHRGTPEALMVAARADEILDRRLIADKAMAALDQLPEGTRSAFVLRDLEELTTAEVAEILGLDPAAVRQRVHRARLALRGMLSAMAGAGSVGGVS
jgi:RNA polymerase sigma-70 factor (ECF subfamily)